MKKVVFTTLITILFSVFSSAQIKKNTFMVGGDLSFEKSNNLNDHWRLTTTAQVGYFVMKNLALGTFFSFDKYGSQFNSWSVSPFARYYVKNAFIQAGYGYMDSNLFSSNSFFNSEIGYAFFLNDNVSLEPAFYFRQGFYQGKTGSAYYGLKIGFQVYLNR